MLGWGRRARSFSFTSYSHLPSFTSLTIPPTAGATSTTTSILSSPSRSRPLELLLPPSPLHYLPSSSGLFATANRAPLGVSSPLAVLATHLSIRRQGRHQQQEQRAVSTILHDQGSQIAGDRPAMMARAPPTIHICMDSDWLKGIVPEEPGMGSSSPSAELIACPRPMHAAAAAADRRLRPQHDQPLKCPRCESTHTKFCYYNNYSLSQPRYFCKTCHRYWTKGGSLRNVPVGGGCRKNKRASAKKHPAATPMQPRHVAETGLHLSFSGVQLPPPPSAAAAVDPLCSLGLLDWKYDPILAGSGSAAGSLDGASAEAHFAGAGMLGIPGGGGGGGECHALSSLRYAAGLGESMEVKPAATESLLSLDWYSETSRAPESAISSLGALGLWSGMLRGAHQHHGSSAAI